MADQLQLAAAVLARLRGMRGVAVLDGVVSSTPPGPYVVFYDAAPRLTARSLAGVANRLGWTFQLVCAGRDPDETRYLVGLALGLLKNWRPTAERAASWLVPVPDGAPIITDESVPGDTRFSQTLTFRLTTRS